METEANNDYNNGIGIIVKDLYKLRQIEHSTIDESKKYSKSKTIIRNVTQNLINTNNYVAFRPMWEELHDRMVYYYEYLNNSNLNKSMPLFRETLHNDVVQWWLECKNKGKLSSTILHFDTHDDMGLPSTSKYLLKNGSLYEQGIKDGSCGQIYWPITCILLSKAVDHVIWCTPKWVYDDDGSYEQTLICEKDTDEFVYLRDKTQPKDNYRMKSDVLLVNDINDSKKYKFYSFHHFDRVKSSTQKGWNKLAKKIQKSTFILDIDLDFFVTNGDKISNKKYKEDYDDIESIGRVHEVPGIIIPRATYDDPYSKKVIKDLNKETKLIHKRIDIFLKGLKTLKDKNIVPSCINISDSAPSFLSGNISRAVFTNQYTPKYFIPLLYSLLIQGLHDLYGKTFI
jgi:hypothetical protein